MPIGSRSAPARPPRGISWGFWSGRAPALAGAFALSAALLVPPATVTAYDPSTDPYSMDAIARSIGANAWWNAGFTGAGVDVAVIDTGVSPVEGLAGAGKIINGPDLSLESQNPTFRYLDTNGHGTFMAGLIAGNSATYKGIAPDARIVSVKVGVADGGADVSQVIAAIAWVIQNRNSNGLNIRVLSLSFGTDSAQSYRVDPLAHAVEQAWEAGIFVVAATGNAGYVSKTGSLTNPAFDPTILAVGATDSMGTLTLADDIVAAYSSTGSSARYVDVVAPGSHLVGLRVPGSHIDQNYGSTGYISSTRFRGSGTSQAAAIVSGAAALAIQKYPWIDPLTLKFLFRTNTRVLTCGSCSQSRQGQGAIDLAQMLATPPFTKKGSLPKASTGAGSLEASRGSEHLTRDGVVLSGERDIFGRAFDSAAMAALLAAGNSWSGGTWNGNSWSGNSWSGNSWSGNSWSGNSWSGNSWSGNSWSGNSWSGNSWSTGSWD